MVPVFSHENKRPSVIPNVDTFNGQFKVVIMITAVVKLYSAILIFYKRHMSVCAPNGEKSAFARTRFHPNTNSKVTLPHILTQTTFTIQGEHDA